MGSYVHVDNDGRAEWNDGRGKRLKIPEADEISQEDLEAAAEFLDRFKKEEVDGQWTIP